MRRINIQAMYWFFAIVCVLLLAFHLEPVLGRPSHNHYAMIWTWNTFRLLHVLPSDVYVLVDGTTCYLYLETESTTDTYIPAIHLEKKRTFDILHYRYLLDWIKDPPVIKAYSPDLASNIIDILNFLGTFA